MVRCANCGAEVEEGRSFCPHCSQPAAGTHGAAAAESSSQTSLQTVPQERRDAGADATARAVPMAAFERHRDDADKSRRIIYIAVAVVSAVLVAGIVWLVSRPRAQTAEEHLAGAIRAGTPEFEQYRDRLVVDFNPDENATIGERALGDLQVGMTPTVRNFTGRIISGLEFHAAGYDLDRRLIRERTFVRQLELEPNRVSTFTIPLNFPKDNRPASLKLELTGFTFKE